MNLNLLAGLLAVGEQPHIIRTSLLDAPFKQVTAFFLLFFLFNNSNIAQCDQLNAGIDMAICEGETVQLLATGGDNYTWSPAAGLSCTACPDPVASPNVTTTYMVSCDDNGTISTDEIVIEVSPEPNNISVIASPATTCDSGDGDLIVQASGGTGDLQFSKDNGNTFENSGGTPTSKNFFNLVSGKYQIKVRNSNGTCEVDGGEWDVSSNDAPVGTIASQANPGDCASADGRIEVTGSGGSGSYQYSFNNGVNWQAANSKDDLTAGFYQIMIRNLSDASCETNVGNVQLVEPESPTIGDVVTTNPDCGNTNGTIIVTASGSGDLEYRISPGADWQDSNEFNAVTGGDYTVEVRTKGTATCFTAWSNNPVTIVSGTTPTFTSNDILDVSQCGSSDGVVTINATGDVTLEYSIDGGTTYQTPNTFTNLAAGNYPIMIRNMNGTCPVSGGNAIVNEPSMPTISAVTPTNPMDCASNDGEIVIEGTGGSIEGSYQYSINGGNTWEANGTFQNLAPGRYNIAIQNGDGTCPVNGADVDLTVAGGITVNNITSTDPSACGVADGEISISLAGGTGSYQFSINGGTFASGAVIGGLTAGTYTLQGQNSDGTCITSLGTINLGGTLSISIDNVMVTQSTNCNTPNGSIAITASGNGDDLEYSLDGTTFKLENTFSALADGNYTPFVRYATTDDCTVMGDEVTLEPAEEPMITGLITPEIVNCGGTTSISVILSDASTDEYEFSNNGGTTFQLNSVFGALSAGSYDIRVQYIGGGCQVSGGVQIISDPEPPVINNITTVDPMDCGQSNGSITIIASKPNGSPDLEYSINDGISWRRDPNGNVFSNLQGGDYDIRVRYINATCEVMMGDGVTTLNAPSSPTINSVTPVSPMVCGADDGTITFDVTGGSGSYSYSIDGGTTYQDDMPVYTVSGGTYAVMVSNQDGSCIVSGGTVTVEDEDPPVITTVDAQDPTGCGLSDGQIIITATGNGNQELRYSIDGGTTYVATNAFTNLAEDTYDVYVSYVGEGCPTSAGAPYILDNPDAPDIDNIDAINPDCMASNGSIMIDASHNGTADLEYSINGGTSYQTSPDFSGLNSMTNYPIRVRVVGSACVITGGTITLEDEEPPVISFVNTLPSDDCANPNGTIEIFTSGGTPVNYEYSITNGISFQDASRFENVSPGTYDVAIRVKNTECVTNHDEQAVVDAPATPIIDNITSGNPDCDANNGTITIAASGGEPPYQYTIDGGLNWLGMATFMNLRPGNYRIGVRNSNTMCEVFSDNAVSLVEPDGPDINMLNSQNPSCDGGDGRIEIVATGTKPLEYSIDGGNSYVSTNVFQSLVVGSYPTFVRYTDMTCAVNAGMVQLTEPERPSMTDINKSNPSDCGANDGTIQITATGSVALEYSIDDGATYQSSNVFNGLGAGNYLIRVRFADRSCEIFGGLETLSSPESPTIDSVDFTDPEDCDVANGSITITATMANGTDIDYSINGGQTFQPSNVFNGLSGGDYEVQVRNRGGSCVVSNGVTTLATLVAPQITEVTTQDPDCGATDGEITITASGIGDIEYSIDGGGTYVSSNTFTGLAEGIYSVRVRNTNMTCEVSNGSVTISEPSAATVTSFDATNPDCNGSNGSIVINTSGGEGNLSYSIDNGTTYQASNTFENLEPGTYDIFVRNEDGRCVQFGGTTELVPPDVPVIDGVNSTATTACNTNDATITVLTNEENVEFSIDGGQTYQDDNEFTDLMPGDYDVRARRTGQTCEVLVAALTIDQPNQPMATTASTNPTDCGLDDGTITVTPTEGSDALEYSLDNVNYQIETTFFDLMGGDYTVYARFVDNPSCFMDLETVTLIAPDQPVITDVNTQEANCETGTGSITISATGASIEYSIDNGETYQMSNGFTGLAPGDYRIAVRNTNGICVTMGEVVTISSNATPIISDIETRNPTDCGLANGRIIISISGGGSYEYSINGGTTFQSSSTFSALDAGTYEIRVRNIDGTCEVSGDDVVLMGGTPPTFTEINQSNPTTCGANDGTITITASGNGIIEYSIDGTDFQRGNVFTELSPGSYQATIRYSNGACPVTSNSLITLIGATAATIDEVNFTEPTSCGASDASITITASGEAALRYSIDGGQTYQDENTFTGLSAGTYQIRVRNTDGSCEVSADTDVVLSNDNAPTINSVATVDAGDCGGTNGQIGINVDDTTDLEFSIDGGATYQSSNIFENLVGGNYNVFIRTISGSCTIEHNQNPVVVGGGEGLTISDVSFTNPTACGMMNGSISISLQNLSAPVEYSIDGGATYGPIATFVNLDAGTYTIAVRRTNGECETIGEMVTLVVGDSPMITDISFTEPTSCGAGDGTITITATSDDDLEYSIDNGATFQTENIFSDLGNGTYDILVRTVAQTCAVNGDMPVVLEDCCNIRYIIEQLPNGMYQVSLIADMTFTENDRGTASAQITVVAPNGAFEIENFMNSAPDVAFQVSSIRTPVDNPDFNYYVFDLGTATTAIDYQEDVKIPLFTFGNSADCAADGASLMLYDPETDPYQGNDVGQSIDIMGYGDQEITICYSGATGNVPLPSVLQDVMVFDPMDCMSNGGIMIVTETGAAVEYSIDGGVTYQASESFENLAAGSYNVMIRRTDITCEFAYSQNPVVLMGNPAPMITNVEVVNPSSCNLRDGSITILPNDPNLEYSINGGETYQPSNVFNNFSAGIYDVFIRYMDNSCPVAYDQGPVELVDPSEFVIINDVTVLQADCTGNGASVTIDASGCNNLEYSLDGATFQPTNTFINIMTGTYAVIARSTNDTNISDSRSITVEANAMCTDTITTFIPPTGSMVCLDEVLDIPNGVGTNTICGEPMNMTLTVTDGASCVTIVPNEGFDGSDFMCVVTCDNIDTNVCDTTYIAVTVQEIQTATDTITTFIPPTGSMVCLDEVLDIPNGVGTNTICGEPMNMTFTVTDGASCVTIVPNEGFDGSDFMCVVTCDNIDTNVCDTTYIAVTVREMETSTDTIRLTIPQFGGTTTCLGGLLELPNGAGMITSCSPVGNIAFNPVADSEEVCVDIEAIDDFTGTEELCLVVCDRLTPDVCDTTILVVTVMPENMVIRTDTIRMNIVPDDPTQICINQVVTLPNGNGDSSFCDSDNEIAANIVSFGDDICVNFTPPAGFSGTDTICVQTCDVLEPSICDTTIFILTVDNPVEPTPLPDTIRLMTPIERSIEQCFGQFILPAENVTISSCGDPTNGTIAVDEDTDCVTYFPNLGFIGMDEYCVVFCDATDATNCDTTYVLIDVIPFTDEIVIEVDNTMPFDTCIDAVLDLLGNYQNSSICGVDANDVMVTLDQTCLTIDPNDDFEGTTEICVVVCDDNMPQVCDTTIITLVVTPAGCTEDIFTMNSIILPADTDGEICVPVPFSESSTYAVMIDGTNYTQTFGQCDIDSSVVYFYGPIDGVENLEVTSWLVENQSFSGTITTGVQGLLAFLNTFDPNGEEWMIDMVTQTLRTSNNSNSDYGNLTITPEGGAPTTLGAGEFGVANGFSIIVAGEGEHTVTVTNTATGCSDQLMVTIEGTMTPTCDILPNIPISIDVDDCMEVSKICLNESLANLDDYNLMINGELYQSPFVACGADTMYRYLYLTLPDLGVVGPYTVDSWMVNETALTGDFMNIGELVELMNTLDPGGDWSADPTAFALNGGNNDNSYGELTITQTNTSANTVLTPDVLAQPTGVAIELMGGTYNLVLTDDAGTCQDELDIVITCPDDGGGGIFRDTTLEVTIVLGNTENICASDILGIMNSDIASITNTCPEQSGDNSTVIIDETTNCIEISSLAEGDDIACIEVCDNMGNCVTITINISIITECPDIIPQDILGMGIDCTTTVEGALCIDIPLAEFTNYDLEVDGEPYTDMFMGCRVDSSFTYSYFTVLDLGEGPYRVESWLVNGRMFSGNFLTIGDLVDSMNVWDETATWIQDEATLNLLGGSAMTTYGSLQISDTVTGASTTIELNRSLVPVGTAIMLPLGTSELVFIDRNTGCRDTVSATLACLSTDTISVNVMVGEIDSVCVDTLELMGDFVSISNTCPAESGELSVVTVTPDSLCVIVEGIEAGEEHACIVVCDDLGICDTTYFDIIIEDDTPVDIEAVDDRDTTEQGGIAIINVLGNDSIPSNSLDTFYIDVPTVFGEATFNEDGTVRYEHDGNACDITDGLTYVICSGTTCDTATVEIYISCDNLTGDFEIFNGFSPNGDGVNDAFRIKGIDAFPDNTLRIYNRWGNRVFQESNYRNEWRGTWESKELPDGTYFYIFDTGTGETMSGYVQIRR